jgi:hypothetical protein
MCHLRRLRLLAVALAVAATTLAVQVPANAAAPFQKTQSASFFRIEVGVFEVTAIYDGGSNFDPKLLTVWPACLHWSRAPRALHSPPRSPA